MVVCTRLAQNQTSLLSDMNEGYKLRPILKELLRVNGSNRKESVFFRNEVPERLTMSQAHVHIGSVGFGLSVS